MNKRRLLKLADLLEADSKNKKGAKFDLEHWASKNGSHRDYKPGEVVQVSCDTKACAIGLACVSGAFKRSGLGYSIEWDGILKPSFEGQNGWSAVRNFFGLGTSGAEFLFSRQEYPKTKTKGADAERFVAKRIRDFVAGKAAPKVAP